MKKYELTNDTKTTADGKVLHRICASRDFGNVRRGNFGGFVESEKNLSHDGSVWIYNKAVVRDHAVTYGKVIVADQAVIRQKAFLSGNVVVCGHAVIGGQASLLDNVKVFGRAKVCENAMLQDQVIIGGRAKIVGHSKICGQVVIGDKVVISGKAVVGGDVGIYGNARVGGDARIFRQEDILIIEGKAAKDTITAYRSKKGIEVTCGDFQGTLEEFERQLKRECGAILYATGWNTFISEIKKYFKTKRKGGKK